MTLQIGQSIQVHAVFATPIVTVEIADAARLNGELKPCILDRAGDHPSSRHSNLGGWQSSWDLGQWGGDAAGELLDQGRAAADRLTADRDGRPVKVDWQTNAWANINRRGHGNEFHTHPGSFWSGTYYVDDGGIGENPELGGEFEVQDPRGVGPAMYAPMLTFAGPGGASLGASYTLQPHSGMIVLFPSWLQHAVRPYRGQKMRISIAFNLSL